MTLKCLFIIIEGPSGWKCLSCCCWLVLREGSKAVHLPSLFLWVRSSDLEQACSQWIGDSWPLNRWGWRWRPRLHCFRVRSRISVLAGSFSVILYLFYRTFVQNKWRFWRFSNNRREEGLLIIRSPGNKFSNAARDFFFFFNVMFHLWKNKYMKSCATSYKIPLTTVLWTY